MRASVLLRVAVTACLAACAGTLPRAETTYPAGLYEFAEHVQGRTSDLVGRLAIVGDSVKIVESTPACIDSRVPPVNSRVQSFECGDFSIVANHQTSTWMFNFATHRIVEEHVEVCVAYSTVDGRQVCRQSHTERREREVPVRGQLRLTRIEAATPQRPGVP